MQKFGNGFVPLYADHAQMIDCTVEALDEYGRWLGEQVRAWDPATDRVEDLRDLLAEVREVLGEINQIAHVGADEERYGIDLADLPSVEIPEEVLAAHTVWAVDAYGNALVGECADEVCPARDLYGGGWVEYGGRVYGLLQQAYCVGRVEYLPGYVLEGAYAASACEIETGRPAEIYWVEREEYDPAAQDESDACDWGHPARVIVEDSKFGRVQRISLPRRISVRFESDPLQIVRVLETRSCGEDGVLMLVDAVAADGLAYDGLLVYVVGDGRTETARGRYDHIPPASEDAGGNSGEVWPIEDPVE